MRNTWNHEADELQQQNHTDKRKWKMFHYVMTCGWSGVNITSPFLVSTIEAGGGLMGALCCPLYRFSTITTPHLRLVLAMSIPLSSHYSHRLMPVTKLTASQAS